jgi:hypothetical protein
MWVHVLESGGDIEIVREDPPEPEQKWLDGLGFPAFKPIPHPRSAP